LGKDSLVPYVCNLVYLIALLFASPWILWQAIRHGKYRRGFAAKLFGQVPRLSSRTSDSRCIWFHAVSVGEVMVLEPLIRAARQKWPRRVFVISSTSRTGFELARRRFADEIVTYAPLDFSWAVTRAIQRLDPEMLVLVELELWPNLIWAAHRAGLRLAIVNGRLSAKSATGYAWIRPLVARLLQKFDLLAVQNDEYADRFRQLGALKETIVVTGSMKFDGARTDRDNPRSRRLAAWANLGESDRLFLAGSTQAPEELFALDAYKQLKPLFPKLRLALVPRHPQRFEEVARMLAASGLTWARRSSARGQDQEPPVPPDVHVLLIDTVGELADWWGRANIGFVGGSFGNRGGQNMIEPAAFGVATCFGPNTINFREISAMLIQANAARVVSSPTELMEFVRHCLTDPSYAHDLGQRAVTLIEHHRGAVARTMGAFESVLQRQSGRRSTRSAKACPEGVDSSHDMTSLVGPDRSPHSMKARRLRGRK
jgi:3-deoxy-D-manno-octulosonic-acid transferase